MSRAGMPKAGFPALLAIIVPSLAVAAVFAIMALASATASRSFTPVDVLTFHNDVARTGRNAGESILTPANVNVGQFGKLFSFAVDGYAYAQPLFVSQLAIPGNGTHDVVYVATENDSVYAFDAGASAAQPPLWQVSFLQAPNITTISSNYIGCDDLVPQLGITSTPAISLEQGALYVVSETEDTNTGQFTFALHALDLATGAEKFGGPVAINATVPGNGYDSDDGIVEFNAGKANQRAALLLSNGILYIAFASHCDIDPYHGWVLAYDASTLEQTAVFSTTPNGQRGGIWQCGNGPAASPSGNIFVAVGNGTFDANRQGNVDYGDSVVKLDPKTLAVLDYFTPSDQAHLNAQDLDMGNTGVLMLPDETSAGGPVELLSGAKLGPLFVVNRDEMGGFCKSCGSSNALQKIPTDSLFGAPAFWKSRVYLAGVNGQLLAYQIASGRLSKAPVASSDHNFGFPGATPAVSSYGQYTGIVWALDTSGYASSEPAVLFAFHAGNLALLYKSDQAPDARDVAGAAVKFAVPTVANGRVYVGTQTELDVYGLLPQQ